MAQPTPTIYTSHRLYFIEKNLRLPETPCKKGVAMKHLIGQITGITIFFVVGVVFIINASVMLVSPQAWFRMPTSIRLSGSLGRAKYGSGWGAFQVRLLGGTILAVIAWVIHDAAIHH
jgi:hypothetical protein